MKLRTVAFWIHNGHLIETASADCPIISPPVGPNGCSKGVFKRMHPKRARPKGTQTSLVCRSFAPLGLFFANYGVRDGIVGFYAEKLLLTAASIAQLAKLIRVALRRIAVNAKAVRSHNPGWFPPKTPQKGAAK